MFPAVSPGNRFKDLTGQRFGRLTVISRAPNRGVEIVWHCLCDCGAEYDAMRRNLLSGTTVSCGCRRHKHTTQQKTPRRKHYCACGHVAYWTLGARFYCHDCLPIAAKLRLNPEGRWAEAHA